MTNLIKVTFVSKNTQTPKEEKIFYTPTTQSNVKYKLKDEQMYRETFVPRSVSEQ